MGVVLVGCGLVCESVSEGGLVGWVWVGVCRCGSVWESERVSEGGSVWLGWLCEGGRFGWLCVFVGGRVGSHAFYNVVNDLNVHAALMVCWQLISWIFFV